MRVLPYIAQLAVRRLMAVRWREHAINVCAKAGVYVIRPRRKP